MSCKRCAKNIAWGYQSYQSYQINQSYQISQISQINQINQINQISPSSPISPIPLPKFSVQGWSSFSFRHAVEFLHLHLPVPVFIRNPGIVNPAPCYERTLLRRCPASYGLVVETVAVTVLHLLVRRALRLTVFLIVSMTLVELLAVVVEAQAERRVGSKHTGKIVFVFPFRGKLAAFGVVLVKEVVLGKVAEQDVI